MSPPFERVKLSSRIVERERAERRASFLLEVGLSIDSRLLLSFVVA